MQPVRGFTAFLARRLTTARFDPRFLWWCFTVAIDINQTRQAIPYLLKALVSSATTGTGDADVLDYVKTEMANLVSETGGVSGMLTQSSESVTLTHSDRLLLRCCVVCSAFE